MTAAILTAASTLSQAIRSSRDPLRTLASVLGILASGTDHDEMCNDLERAAADAQTYAEMADEAKEAKRAELEEDGHRYRSLASRCDPMFDALSTVPADLRGPEWDAAARHLVSMQARGVL